MSVSKYRYTEACEGRPCVGDCDLCREWESFEEYDDGEDEENSETIM